MNAIELNRLKTETIQSVYIAQTKRESERDIRFEKTLQNFNSHFSKLCVRLSQENNASMQWEITLKQTKKNSTHTHQINDNA